MELYNSKNTGIIDIMYALTIMFTINPYQLYPKMMAHCDNTEFLNEAHKPST